jgi:hypothetical protein
VHEDDIANSSMAMHGVMADLLVSRCCLVSKVHGDECGPRRQEPPAFLQHDCTCRLDNYDYHGASRSGYIMSGALKGQIISTSHVEFETVE